jgi:hypothetical protein
VTSAARDAGVNDNTMVTNRKRATCPMPETLPEVNGGEYTRPHRARGAG